MSYKKSLKGTSMALALSGILLLASTPTSAVLGDHVLKEGMKHDDVKILQQELKNLGFFNEETTTYFGSLTEQGVRAFQISKGIEINGIFDLSTFKALKQLNVQATTEQVVEGLSQKTKTPTKSALVFNRDLSLKSTGDDVNHLQEALKAMGYLKIDNCTDYFGSQTEGALKAFQQAQGIKQDGVAGLRTIDAINKVLSGRGIVLEVATRGSEVKTLSSDIIATAKKYMGTPYVYGGSSPKGFDCSGFTSYVYKQFGINIPRSSSGQATVGTMVNKSNLQPGDLLIFSNTYKSGVSHTGLYIGNGMFIHSSTTSSGGVIISELNSNYYTKHFSYGRRVL